jgi:hypothetical protein
MPSEAKVEVSVEAMILAAKPKDGHSTAGKVGIGFIGCLNVLSPDRFMVANPINR